MNAFFKLMLKGSAVSALGLVMAAVGCSDSDKETTPGAGGDSGGGKAGSPSAAGSSTDGGDPSTSDGGTAAGGVATTPGGAESGGAEAGGAEAGGAEAGGAAAGGAGGADGLSVAKFCNNLTFDPDIDNDPNIDDAENTTFILEIGEGADKVTFTAATGTCVPADGNACKPIPLGAETPVVLFDADAPTTPLDSGSIDSADGDNWIFYTDVSAGADPAPIVQGEAVTDFTCEEITYDDVYPPG